MSLHSSPLFPVFPLSLLLFVVYLACGCDPGDRAALLEFSDALDSPLWSETNGSTTDCCRWVGVECADDPSSARNSSQRVVTLVLRNMTLSGPVPSGSLGRLSQLKILDLSQNAFSGSIPDELFGLRSLSALDLGFNSFSGSLSPAVGNLSGLVFLSVTMNSLSGSIPDVFHGLERFEHIQVDFNSFSGPFPASLSSCHKLRFMDLSHNNLSGDLNHINFTGLPVLDALVLQQNRFTGMIPNNILSCTNLKVLNLKNNQLYGQIPWGFKTLASLSHLLLGGNKFSNITGALLSLQECQNLTALDLSWSSGKEEILGDGIVGFPNLRLLSISQSNLYGKFPMWLSRSDKLVYLDLSGNHLTGEIPLFLTQLKSLDGSTDQSGDIASPPISGRFVMYISVLPTLDLSSNLLDGNTWTLMSNLTQLGKLNLSHNSFTGSIPVDFSKMTSLQVLDLSSNQISGTIPTSLKQLTFLSYLCVANNSLQGDVPTGAQFSTFPSSCFDGNPNLCYAGKQGCYSPPPHAITPDVQEEEPHKLIDMGSPFAIGVSFGYTTIFLVSGIFYWAKTPTYKRRR